MPFPQARPRVLILAGALSGSSCSSSHWRRNDLCILYHFDRHPVVVKLGTITPEGGAGSRSFQDRMQPEHRIILLVRKFSNNEQ
ncbi:hypothetical protein K438DRAFT_1945734 [Mycena galopus ATCC 62051]|nr:hypothetical protein K438DRAFT_1945734 [Mycena galopus ATCC 62051]